MPTTVVKTIRASGGDYTTLSAWEAANQGDLVAADEVRVAECYNDWPSGLIDAVNIDGSTTDATRYMAITVAAGHRHTGKPDTGFRIVRSSAYSAVIIFGDPSCRASWLDVRNTGAGGTAIRQNGTNGSNSRASRCIARTTGTAAYVSGFATLAYAYQCLAIGAPVGFSGTGTYGTFDMVGCVASGCATGYLLDSPGTTGKRVANCVAYNCTTNYTGTFDAALSGNNASSSGTMPGSSNLSGIGASDFVDAAGHDYHLAGGSALIGMGANLYTLITEDVDGDARPSSGAWDIGLDQVVGGGGTVVDLAGAGVAVASATGALAVGIPLAASATASASASGDLSTSATADLAGAATATGHANGTLSISIPLSASAVAQALASASLDHSVPLGGSASATAGAAGTLTLNVSLAGAAIAHAASTASLATLGSTDLAGNAAASSTAAGALSLAVPLAGAAITLASGTGGLTRIVPLQGAAAAASLATGGLDLVVRLDAAALAQALAGAALGVAGPGSVVTADAGTTADAATTADGKPVQTHDLAAQAGAAALAAGTLTVRVNLAATAIAQAVAAGALAGSGQLVATRGCVVRAKPRQWQIAAAPRAWRVARPQRIGRGSA